MAGFTRSTKQHTISGEAIHIKSTSCFFCIFGYHDLLLRFLKCSKEEKECFEDAGDITLHDTIAVLGQRCTY